MKSLPLSLKIVAGGIIVPGILTLAQMFLELFHRTIHLELNLNLLLLWIGLGLLRLKRISRLLALIVIWLTSIAAPVLVIFLLTYGDPYKDLPKIKILGQKIDQLPTWQGITVCAAVVLFGIWQYRVLTSKTIKHLFGLSEQDVV